MATKKPKTDKEVEEMPVAGLTAVYDGDGAFNTFGDEFVDE